MPPRGSRSLSIGEYGGTARDRARLRQASCHSGLGSCGHGASHLPAIHQSRRSHSGAGVRIEGRVPHPRRGTAAPAGRTSDGWFHEAPPLPLLRHVARRSPPAQRGRMSTVPRLPPARPTALEAALAGPHSAPPRPARRSDSNLGRLALSFSSELVPAAAGHELQNAPSDKRVMREAYFVPLTSISRQATHDGLEVVSIRMYRAAVPVAKSKVRAWRSLVDPEKV